MRFILFGLLLFPCLTWAQEISCKEKAMKEILSLFKDDSKNILGKQFQLTAIKTAILLKKDQGYKETELKSLEQFVNQKQKEISGDESLKKLKEIYANSGKPEDIKKLEGMTARMKAGQYNYYHAEKRILNSDVSAFYLLMENHHEEGIPAFGKEDAAIAWAFGHLASQVKDKTSPAYSKINLSNQVNKLMDARVAGGTDTPVAQLEKMQLESEAEINQSIQETLKSNLSSECLSELKLGEGEDCDESLADIKAEAFALMMKEISDENNKAQAPNTVAGYYGEVKDFIGQLSVRAKPQAQTQTDKKSPPALHSSAKYTERLFKVDGSANHYFGKTEEERKNLYDRIDNYKKLKAHIKCAAGDKKCWTDKHWAQKDALVFRTGADGIGTKCLQLKEVKDGQILIGEYADDCTNTDIPEKYRYWSKPPSERGTKKASTKQTKTEPKAMGQPPGGSCIVNNKFGTWSWPSSTGHQRCVIP